MSDNSIKNGQNIENVLRKRNPNDQQAYEKVLHFISHHGK